MRTPDGRGPANATAIVTADATATRVTHNPNVRALRHLRVGAAARESLASTSTSATPSTVIGSLLRTRFTLAWSA